jgi:hypothetical protein
LLVVALLMPSLYLLSRTRVYGAIRVSVALAGLVVSGAWLLERTSLIAGDPFAGMTDALVQHPFAVGAAFALLATGARYARAPQAALDDHDGEVPARPLLVDQVLRDRLDHEPPQTRPLARTGGGRDRAEDLRAHLHDHGGVVQQVEIPSRVAAPAAGGGDQDVAFAVAPVVEGRST